MSGKSLAGDRVRLRDFAKFEEHPVSTNSVDPKPKELSSIMIHDWQMNYICHLARAAVNSTRCRYLGSLEQYLVGPRRSTEFEDSPNHEAKCMDGSK